MLRLKPKQMRFQLTILILLTGALAFAQEQEPITVGVMETAPFVIKDADGELGGISVELWRAIADDLELAYELKEYPYNVQDLLDAVAAGEVDAAIAAFTITAEREESVDFTHPYFQTGLGIAAQRAGSSDIMRTLMAFFEQFGGPLFLLLAVLLVVGGVVWLVERKHNSEQFNEKPLQGLGDGLWWSAVTMTTVGYGDKAPQTLLGRIVGLVWMFASLFLISFFTAMLASSFTAVQLTPRIQSPEELSRARVGVVDDANSERAMAARNLRSFAYPDLAQAFEDLRQGRLDAVVHDAAILQFAIQENRWTELVVLSETLESEEYGIVFPQGSELVESVNQALLRAVRTEEWSQTLVEFLGDGDH